MMLNQTQKNKIVLMYEEGLSASQISDHFSMSTSGINYHLRKAGVKKRDISDAITKVYKTRFGKKQFNLKKDLTEKEKCLKSAGVMLYWAEGTKTRRYVAFTNSDPKMIRIIVEFFRTICGVSEERLRGQIHAYTDHNVDHLLDFWSKITKIPKEQFQQTYVHKQKIGSYKKNSKYGTVTIRYSDKELIKVLLNWIEEETSVLLTK